jgi:ribosomal protein S12 methylthiotransferase accessory factor
LDYDHAVLSALTEIIERDSLAIFWLHQLPMPRIRLDAFDDPRIRLLLERNRAAGIENHLVDMTTDVGVPVIGIVQTCERFAPHVVAMGACRVNAADAALRVLEEAGSLRIALSGVQRSAPKREAFFTNDSMDPEDFGLLYAGRQSIERFAFATSAPMTNRVPASLPPNAALATIVERLRTLGMEVIAVDVTQPEIADFGLRVVKVIVPELMPISFSHQIRFLDHPRAYAATETLGYGRRTEETITDDPIPYA